MTCTTAPASPTRPTTSPTETTVPGEGVDVSVLPIIGLSGRLDWGKHSYEAGTNGGIVGTVSYDTTRNEVDPRYAAVEAWQPGVSNLPVKLYAPVACGTNAGAPCDASGRYELEANGAFKKATVDPLQTYLTETWQRPSGCVARGVDGNPVVGQQVLPTSPDAECLEGPLMGVQFGPMPDNPATPTNFGAAVDGNYGFGGLTPAITWSKSRSRTMHSAGRCTSLPGKKTSISPTGTPLCRKFRRRNAPVRCITSTWPVTAPTITARLSETAIPCRLGSPCPHQRRR